MVLCSFCFQETTLGFVSSETKYKSLRFQVKRFRMETKAAKTLGIIVGGFVCCWLPFFTMYLVRAFCRNCINPLMFSILFWLGYCNSAINPLIYALFSKDFRFAFKRIICRCFCTDKGSHNSRRGSDGSQLQVGNDLNSSNMFHFNQSEWVLELVASSLKCQIIHWSFSLTKMNI